MVLAKPGDTVTVSYIGTLDNGRIFDSTDADGPLTFTIGNKQIFPALERAVIGMRAGEQKHCTCSEEATDPGTRIIHQDRPKISCR
jgi:FKBP-type peptidyl-prolyl cis-trans isomerase 2